MLCCVNCIRLDGPFQNPERTRCAASLNNQNKQIMYVPADAPLGRSELLARCDGCEINLVDGEALSKGTAGGADRTPAAASGGSGGRARRRSVGVGPRAVGKVGHCLCALYKGAPRCFYRGERGNGNRTWQELPGKPIKEGSDRTWRRGGRGKINMRSLLLSWDGHRASHKIHLLP